jgi:malate synthase
VSTTFEMNRAPEGFKAERDLPAGFMKFYLPLHNRFTPRQQLVHKVRARTLKLSHEGQLPQYPAPSAATEDNWKITLPEWCQDQRNQMTGPADDAELVVKMLNSGAPGVMLDLEDSMANQWPSLMRGYENILKAITGELSYFDKKRDKQVTIAQSGTVIFNRLRGLHLSQAGVLGALTSASLFDLCMLAFQASYDKLKHPLTFYIPKSESAEEAHLWRDMFQAVAESLNLPHDYFKCMALVEAHPLAYQAEEFIYALREHIIGLNLGRWDYMASLIHFNINNPAWVLPDRNTIPHDVAFFQNLRNLLPEICHKRGIFAIGGMTALFPDRQNPELNARALAGLEKDKKNEASCLMDGAWTGHPDQNEIAVSQFPKPNQIAARKAGQPRYPDLRPAPVGVGTKTVAGTRAAARIAIRYRHGVLSGKGASLLDGYMEDLATDRIYRLMIAQRIKHRDAVVVVDDSGTTVKHTPELVAQIFDEELAKLQSELGKDEGDRKLYKQARDITENMIREDVFDPI